MADDKKTFKLILKVTISLAILFFIFTKIDFLRFLQAIRNINLLYFLAGLILYLGCFSLFTKRWQVITRYLHLKFSYKLLLKLNFLSSFYGTFLPGGALTGETIKSYRLVKEDVSWGEKAVASIFLDRLFGTVALFVLAVPAILLTPERNFSGYANIVFIIFVTFFVLILILIFIFNQAAVRLLIKPIRYIAARLKWLKIDNYISSAVTAVFSCCNSFKFFFEVGGLAVLVHILYSLAVYFVALSAGISISVFSIIWINTLATLFSAIPVTVSGLGIREGSFVVLLSLLGVLREQALALSLLVLMIYIIVALIGGAIELFLLSKNRYVRNHRLYR